MYTREAFHKLAIEVRAARAQIDQQATLLDTCGSQINALEAQIAAKDAALREVRDAIERSYSFTDWSPIVERINAALAAPARETE